jgi:lysyl-tRNA synthetase class 1
MFGKPTAAKRLYFDVIPKNVDEYLTFLAKYSQEPPERQIENPVWHIHDGRPPQESVPLTFGVLLNLASVCNTEDKSVLWGFVSRYVPGATAENHPILDQLVGHAIRYYADFVKPAKRYRSPTETERQAISALADALEKMPAGASAEDLQNEVYEVGKRFGFEQLRDWFRALYEVLLGQEQGPRMGSFIALYGVPETVALIRQALSDEGLSAA